MRKSKYVLNNNRMAFETIAIILAFLCILLAILADIAVINVPPFLVMKISPVDDYIFTLFSIQATVATVGIAVVSIITGVNNESYMGIAISEYITSIKPPILTHKRLLIISLSLIIFNYLTVSFKLVNMCIALFIISVVIEIRLVSDVYLIFSGTEKLQSNIRTYIVNHYDASQISAIRKDLIHAIETNQMNSINDCLSLIKEIFQIEVTKAAYNVSTVEMIANVVSEAFTKTVRFHNPLIIGNMMTCIYDLYVIANAETTTVHRLNLWTEVYYDYYKGLDDLSDEQVREDYNYCLIHKELHKNMLYNIDRSENDSLLTSYLAGVYNALLFSLSNRRNSTKKIIKRTLFELATNQLFYGYDREANKLTQIRTQELCLLMKAAIDRHDLELVEDYFFSEWQYKSDKEEFALSMLIIFIYLYYLAARETLESGRETQEFARSVLHRNKEFVSCFWLDIDVTNMAEKYRLQIFQMLSRWEQIDEGEMKAVIMDDTIDDFFVFAICLESWNKERILQMIRIVSPNDVFGIYQRYLSNGYRENTHRQFESFCELFDYNTDSKNTFESKMALLEDALNERYHDEAIEKSAEYILTEYDKDRLADALCEGIVAFSKDTFSRFRSKNTEKDNPPIVEKKNQPILIMNLSNFTIKSTKSYTNISNHIIQQIMYIFLNCISDHVDYKEVPSNSKDKQTQLIELVTSSRATPTLVIGNKDTFWGESDPQILSRFTEKMDHIKFPGGHNVFFIVDGRKIEFCMDNVRIEYSDTSLETIQKYCRIADDGQLYYNITNDIYIPFDQDEVIRYVRDTHTVVTAYADFSFRVFGSKIGADMQIVK